ncbi:MAG TPA: zinc ribbon domain-containing protein [Polyangiaceae bacterium]
MSARNAIRFLVPLVVLIGASLAGSFFGAGFAILVLAGGVLMLVISLLWSSVQSLTGESELSFEEALSLGARSVEEEQKRAVLRALKDLEYERSVGKISEQDYATFTARYRAEAKQLIQVLDENLGAARKQVEDELARRLSADDASKREQASKGLVTAPAELAPAAKASVTLRACAKCETDNELDARFCKKCGMSLAAEGERLCPACPARFAKDLGACPDCGRTVAETP